MAHIEDRWTQPGPTGRRVKSERHGTGLRWLAVWTEPDGRRRKRAFATKDAAQAHLDDIAHKTRSGTYVSAERGAITTADWSVIWLNAQTHLKASGKYTTDGIIRKHIIPTWGTVPIGAITHEEAQAWLNTLPVAASTVRRIHGVFLKMLEYAVKAKRLQGNPVRGLTMPRPVSRTHRYLTVAEIDGLLEVINPAHQALTRCLAFTGMRFGEAAELRVKDIDLRKRQARVSRSVNMTTGTPIISTPKTAAGTRTVPLPSEVFLDVKKAIAGKGREELVYPTAEGMQFRKDNYRRAFLIAAKKVGLEGVRTHDLRHTAVSLAVASGASVKLIQLMLGHTSAAITLDVYAGLFEQDLSVVTERMDSFIAGERVRLSAPREPPGEAA